MNFVTDPESFARLAEDDGDPSLNPMQKLHERFRAPPQVTIAKLAGFARGGGHELALALDMRFAATGRTGLAQCEALMAIIPGGGGTQYLARLAGRARSLEVILGAELFSAELAERYGFINRALPPKQLDGFSTPSPSVSRRCRRGLPPRRRRRSTERSDRCPMAWRKRTPSSCGFSASRLRRIGFARRWKPVGRRAKESATSRDC